MASSESRHDRVASVDAEDWVEDEAEQQKSNFVDLSDKLDENVQVSTLDDDSDGEPSHEDQSMLVRFETSNQKLNKDLTELKAIYQEISGTNVAQNGMFHFIVQLPIFPEDEDSGLTSCENLKVTLEIPSNYPHCDLTIRLEESPYVHSLPIKDGDIVDRSWRRDGADTVPCLAKVIEHFYVFMEECEFGAEKEIIVRDYFYHVSDPRHWGRPFNTEADSEGIDFYPGIRANALYDFTASNADEISMEEGETMVILNREGDGWVTATRMSDNPDDEVTGLIPENYIDYIKEE